MNGERGAPRMRVLKWLQIAVAVLATVTVGMIFPGIMVVIPLGLGILYIVCAVGAMRERRIAIWSAFVMSFAAACWSGYAANRMGFEAIHLWVNPPPVADEGGPLPALDDEGRLVLLNEPSPATEARLREIAASARTRGAAMNALMIVLFVAAATVVVMHLHAWRWLLGRHPAGP